MKFALFEFCEDSSCAVGESKWIVDYNNALFKNKDWIARDEIMVCWPTKQKDYMKWSSKNGIKGLNESEMVDTKTHVAKVLKFSGKFAQTSEFLHYILTRFWI